MIHSSKNVRKYGIMNQTKYDDNNQEEYVSNIILITMKSESVQMIKMYCTCSANIPCYNDN